MKSRNVLLTCRRCPFFRGNHCNITLSPTTSDSFCHFVETWDDLTLYQSSKILSRFQHWRRGGKGEMPSGFLIGLALDKALQCLRKEVRDGGIK